MTCTTVIFGWISYKINQNNTKEIMITANNVFSYLGVLWLSSLTLFTLVF